MSIYALHKPLLGKAELSNVKNCLKTSWLSSARKYIKQFENKLEQTIKKKVKLTINQSKINNVYFNHNNVGFNYGLFNINTGIGIAQIKRLKKILK